MASGIQTFAQSSARFGDRTARATAKRRPINSANWLDFPGDGRYPRVSLCWYTRGGDLRSATLYDPAEPLPEGAPKYAARLVAEAWRWLAE